jgi:sec-independent protein translocase protein TatA
MPAAAMKCLATYGNRQMLGRMSLFALLPNLGGPDLIIILLIILVLFGAKKLPELARGMGSAIKEFQKAKDEFTDELHSAGKTEVPKPGAPAATVPQIENQPPASAQARVEPEPTRVPNPDRTDRI